MSKISEWGFSALYRTLVAQPGQMQLFDAPAQPADEPVVEIIDAETGAFIAVPTIEAAEAHIAADHGACVESISTEATGTYYLVTYLV
jgi:hypothetical protein